MRNDELQEYYDEKQQIRSEEMGFSHPPNSSNFIKMRQPTAAEKAMFLEIVSTNSKKMPNLKRDALLTISICQLNIVCKDTIEVRSEQWSKLI